MPELLARGAAKVHATARTPRTWDDERVVPLRLDVTVLVDNAGASPSSFSILTQTDEEIRANVEVNFLGPLFLARAFAPVLSATGKGTVVDVISAMSWYAAGGTYSATKAALSGPLEALHPQLAPSAG